jgi:aminoglycoside phosphotransferase (APT) family kinase protein
VRRQLTGPGLSGDPAAGSLSDDPAGGLPDDVTAWIEQVGGGTVVLADQLPGGARKEAWAVDLAGPGGTTVELFLHYDRSDPSTTGDPWTLHREASVYLALQGTGVPVPRVLGVHAVRQAMLSERLVGENWFSRITDPAEAEQTARHFMGALAALHRLDPATLELPYFPEPTTVPDAVRHELDEWDATLAVRGGRPDPALAFTLDWLRANIPDYDGPVVLVQGDTGPGNFMFAGGRVVAVVDWELAHLGDPMDDIAWLTLRATQEPFPDLPARLREYEVASGHAIDVDRVRYYQVMAEAKLQVMSHRGEDGTGGAPGGGRGRSGADVGNGFIYATLHRRLWFEALAVAAGLELTAPETPPDTEPRDHQWMYGVVLDQLRDVVVPGITDPLARVRAKGVARMVKYLEQVDRHGDFYDACEFDDLEAILSHRPPSLDQGRQELAACVRSGRVPASDYLAYLWRRVARDNELARPAMGALADRHWPPLR